MVKTSTVQEAVLPGSNTAAAVMTALPGALAVTRPDWSTLATDASELVQVTWELVMVQGSTLACSCLASPAMRRMLLSFSVTPAT